MKFTSPIGDTTFKTLWIKGNKDVRKYLDRMVEYTIGKSLDGYVLGPNDTGVISYKSIANEVDILLVSLDHKVKINVEMNNLSVRSSKQNIEKALNKSNIYLGGYVNSFYNDIPKEERYSGSIKVEQVNFNNFYYEDNKLISELHFSFTDKNYNITKNGVKSHHIYLPRMKELCYDEEEDIYKDFALLLANSYEEMDELAKGNKEREKVVEYLKWLGRDDEFMAMIDREEYNEIQMKTSLAYEKELGIQEGKQEGIQEGIQEGNHQTTIEIAKKLKEQNVDTKIIVSATNLTKEEVEKL